MPEWPSIPAGLHLRSSIGRGSLTVTGLWSGTRRLHLTLELTRRAQPQAMQQVGATFSSPHTDNYSVLCWLDSRANKWVTRFGSYWELSDCSCLRATGHENQHNTETKGSFTLLCPASCCVVLMTLLLQPMTGDPARIEVHQAGKIGRVPPPPRRVGPENLSMGTVQKIGSTGICPQLGVTRPYWFPTQSPGPVLSSVLLQQMKSFCVMLLRTGGKMGAAPWPQSPRSRTQAGSLIWRQRLWTLLGIGLYIESLGLIPSCSPKMRASLSILRLGSNKKASFSSSLLQCVFSYNAKSNPCDTNSYESWFVCEYLHEFMFLWGEITQSTVIFVFQEFLCFKYFSIFSTSSRMGCR